MNLRRDIGLLLSAILFSAVSYAADGTGPTGADTRTVRLDVRIEKGTKTVAVAHFLAVNGMATRMHSSTDTSYVGGLCTLGDGKVLVEPSIARDGFEAEFTPTITPAGDVELEVTAKVADITSWRSVSVDQQQLRVPELAVYRVHSTVTIAAGADRKVAMNSEAVRQGQDSTPYVLVVSAKAD